MESQALSLISPIILIAIGIGLIALEAITFLFVLFWFGVASILVGVLSYIIKFPDGFWQLSVIAIIAMVLLLTLRNKALKVFLKPKSKENNDNFLNEKGVGVIQGDRVYYKATTWNIDSDNGVSFKDKEKVMICRIEKGIAYIKKIDTLVDNLRENYKNNSQE